MNSPRLVDLSQASTKQLLFELKLRKGPDWQCQKCGYYADGSGQWACPGCGVWHYFTGSMKWPVENEQSAAWRVRMIERYVIDPANIIPSNPGEATRLREALVKIVDVLSDDTSINAQRINNIIIHALSKGDTEPVGVQRVDEIGINNVIRHYEGLQGLLNDPNWNGGKQAIREEAKVIRYTLYMLGITIPGITEEGVNSERD